MKHFKENFFLNLFALSKIPLISFCGAKIVEIGDQRIILKIPLSFRTKNHLDAMYFGALAIGADLCVGFLAMRKIQESGEHIDLVFKDFNINFLKRAEGDVHFVCEQGSVVLDQVAEAKSSDERINRTIHGYAIVPSVNPEDKVAEFQLTLSVKRRVKKKT